VPFRPTGDKPVFCSNCFGKGERSGGGNNAGPVNTDSNKKQFEMLNAKLDSILKMLSPKTTVEKTVKKEVPIEKVIKKADKKKVAAPKKAVKKVVAKKKKK
jgi:ribosomal protein L17